MDLNDSVDDHTPDEWLAEQLAAIGPADPGHGPKVAKVRAEWVRRKNSQSPESVAVAPAEDEVKVVTGVPKLPERAGGDRRGVLSGPTSRGTLVVSSHGGDANAQPCSSDSGRGDRADSARGRIRAAAPCSAGARR